MKFSFFYRMLKKFELNNYDDFTIGTYFQKQGAQVGQYNRIMVRSLGESPRLVSIGNHCTISSEVVFLTHDGAGWLFTDELPSLQKFGIIKIYDNCFIGYRSILLPNVSIGPNAIVGAGAVVTKDVEPGSIVAGNPARKISTVDLFKEKLIETWASQKPPGYLNYLKDGVAYDPRTIQQAKQREKARIEEHLLKLFAESGK